MQNTNSMDPKDIASNVYKLLNENDTFRVFEVVFKPGDTAKMHHHPKHAVYAKSGGRLRMTSAGKTSEIDIKEGSVLFLEAQNHEATNIGNSTVELIVVESKK